MLRSLALALFALAFLAPPSLAAPGLKLSWDHCAADGRVANKDFACGTNDGSDVLVLSYEPSEDAPGRTGVEITLHIEASGSALPSWWEVRNTGACRADALTIGSAGDPGSACLDPYGGAAVGGIADFSAHYDPGLWRLRSIVAVPPENTWTMTPGNEYFVARFMLSHVKTVGTEACGGCLIPTCLALGKLKFTGALYDLTVYALGSSGPAPFTVSWQGAYVREYTSVFERTVDFASMTCDPDDSVPTHRSTWGAVKSLYR